jgi:tRNA (pseudouridine54-N1)-methyltransferase
VRRITIIGRRALASPDFLLQDLAGTSGRLDVLARCLRAALLLSHGLRRDTTVYLVLLGGPQAPRTVRVEGARSRFLRPEERAMATLLKKVLAAAGDEPGFVEVKPGIAVANAGLDAVIGDCAGSPLYVALEGAEDVRDLDVAPDDGAFFFGDHLGLEDDAIATLKQAGARAIGLGPVSVHAEDAIAILANELDRRGARAP